MKRTSRCFCVWAVKLCSALALGLLLVVGGCSSSNPTALEDTGAADGARTVEDVAAAIDSSSMDATIACTNPMSRCGGACVDLFSDSSHCGNCATACATGQTCSKATCSTVCAGGTTPCGTTCVNTQSDPNHCGGCATACMAAQFCSAGTCAISCTGGTTGCGRACVDTHVDPSNCGACGAQCSAGQVCSNGACGLTCAPPLTTCGVTMAEAGATDAVVTASYCANTQTDNANCGACRTVCAAGQVCNAGSCSLTCQSGLLNCDGRCIDPATDNTHCGATPGCGAGDAATAGTACTSGYVCSGGTCGLTCQAGQINCNGTCINPANNNTYCGATPGCGAGDAGSAGTACASGFICSGGACGLTCQAGEIVCNGKCVDPMTNNMYCGATSGCNTADAGSAGATCAGGHVCTAGACALSCQVGQINCNATCIDPTTSNVYCGATPGCGSADAGFAGNSCSNGLVCSAGQCSPSCPAGRINCGGACIDPMTDNAHCGATLGCGGGGSAGVACASGTVCTGGACAGSCGGTQVQCGPSCVDTLSDPMHCGGCVTTCSVAHATNVCASGQCAVLSCNMGYSRCPSAFTGMPITSCTILSTDVSNCGFCGHICSFANAPASCVASTCTMGACNAGFTDCNGDPTDGCEIAGAICPTPNIVFTTSVAYSSNLGGLAGADAKCAARATAASLSGTFLPWLSDGATTPASRFTHPAAGWTLVDGTFVASNWAGLTSRPLRHAISLTETGGTPPTGTVFGAANVWSGTDLQGANENFGTCSSWTGSGNSGAGSSSQTGNGWTNVISGSVCGQTATLYCFQQ